MRFALVFIMMLSFANLASAQGLAPQPENKIKTAMKIMGANLKLIAQTPVDATNQAALVAKAQELRAQILSVVGETPDAAPFAQSSTTLTPSSR